uniref:Variant surface glycoprotein 1125.3082 n=1 Tax=Trypanosoma brucei TaxID=5691 RepID=A0A1J0R9B8_9TRYP|nr:variant surface glycoprotein 1125.3082 [Trypanosoma brucei]
MIKDYNDLQTNSEKLKAFNTEYGLPLSQSKRKILKPQLARLANAAADINSAVTSLDTTIKQTRLQLRKDLLTALYGKAAAPTINAITEPSAALTPLPETQFPWDDTNTRATACATATGDDNKAGAALATDLVCLCVISHSAQADHCGPGTAPTGYFNSGGGYRAKAATAFASLAAACDSKTSAAGTAPTAANIAAAVATFQADLGTNWITKGNPGDASAHASKHRALFGAFNIDGTAATQCNQAGGSDLGTANKGICIDYGNLVKPGKHITWIKALQDAQAKIDQISSTAQAAAAEVTKAETIATQMDVILRTADMYMSPQGAKTPAGAVKEPTAEEQNKCAKFKNNETDCTNNGCNYDSTKKECKPKAEAETTVTGTGETAKEGETTEKCKGKPEKDCTSPDCKWENNACKDSSILVNNQFALSVVSAAFVALLF